MLSPHTLMGWKAEIRGRVYLTAHGLNARVHGQGGAPQGASGDSENPVSREGSSCRRECSGTIEPVGQR